MTEDIKKRVENLFKKLKEVKKNVDKKIKTINDILKIDDINNDRKNYFNKIIDSYKSDIDKVNDEILKEVQILEGPDGIKTFNNIEIKDDYNLEEVKLVNEARKLSLTKEQYNHIMNAINNNRIFNRVAEAKGINIKSRSKAVLEEKEKLRKKVFDRLVKMQQKKDDLIDIKQVLTKLYGADFSKNKRQSNNTNNDEIKPLIDSNGNVEMVDESEIPDELKEKDIKPRKLLHELTKGLDFRFKKDDKNYRGINLEVKKSFKEEVRQGNYIKNIFHFGRSGIMTAAKWIMKKKAQFSSTEEDRKNYEELKKRVNKLSDEEIVAIWNEYHGSVGLNNGKPLIVNTVLLERYSKYVMTKVGNINEEIIEIHKEIYGAYDIVNKIDDKLKNKNISDTLKERFLEDRKRAIDGKADLIRKYEKLWNEGTELLEGKASINSVEQRVKGMYHRGSVAGGILAKGYKEDRDLSILENKLLDAKEEALEDGDDEKALDNFVKYQQLEIKNTKIQSGPLGLRSVGKRYYDPLVRKIDYTEDALVRDVFITAGLILSTVSVGRALANHFGNDQIISDHNDEIELVNAKNKNTMDFVDANAHGIAKSRGQIQEKIIDDAHRDLVGGFNIKERADLDMQGVNWNPASSIYHHYDHANHNLMEDLSSDLYREVSRIERLAKNGQNVDPNLFVDIAHKYNNSFTDAVNQAIDISTKYAQRHPEIKLDGYLDSLSYLQDHAKDMANASVASLNSTYVAESLENLTAENVNAISGISDNLREVLISTGVAGTLLFNSAIQGNKLSVKYRNKYGNEAIKIIEDTLPPEDRVYKKDRKEKDVDTKSIVSNTNSTVSKNSNSDNKKVVNSVSHRIEPRSVPVIDDYNNDFKNLELQLREFFDINNLDEEKSSEEIKNKKVGK